MTVYKVMLPRIGRDSAINYPLSHLMLHVLGVRTPSRLQFFFRTVCMLPLQTCLSLGQDTPPVTRYVRTIMLSTLPAFPACDMSLCKSAKYQLIENLA